LKKHHEAVQVKDVSKEVWNCIEAEESLWRVPYEIRKFRWIEEAPLYKKCSTCCNFEIAFL
jgi:hypothetical protein